MDKTQHKIAMEFFRSEIKSLVKRLIQNKKSHRLNQRCKSHEQPQVGEYDKTGERYWFNTETSIYNDKRLITAIHITYGNVRGKSHISDKEKEKQYDEMVKVCYQRMEKYIREKNVNLTSEITSSDTGRNNVNVRVDGIQKHV
jgi:hypothetical protein